MIFSFVVRNDTALARLAPEILSNGGRRCCSSTLIDSEWLQPNEIIVFLLERELNLINLFSDKEVTRMGLEFDGFPDQKKSVT